MAEELFGIRATASELPSERDQNFLLTDEADRKFVLKIANPGESRAFLEAENSVLKHLAERVSFCQRLVPTTSGEEIATFQGHFVRIVDSRCAARRDQVAPARFVAGSRQEAGAVDTCPRRLRSPGRAS